VTIVGIAEADWIRWIGIGIGIAGACITGLAGLRWLLTQVKGWGLSLAKKVRRLLFPRPVQARPTAAGVSVVAGNLKTDVSRGWNPNTSIEQKIERLKEIIDTIQQDMNTLRTDVAANHSTVMANLVAAEERVQEQIERLEKLIRRAEAEEARADGRGLLPIAFGFLLAGIPVGLATWHPDLGMAITVIAVAITIYIGFIAARDACETRSTQKRLT
jgi:hypothetical protein